MRTDGLPNPITDEQMFLAALLDEIRGLRQDLSSQTKVIPHVYGNPDITHIKEPEVKKSTQPGRKK